MENLSEIISRLQLSDSMTPGQRVVVAMSGGVDSCASALLLHEAGYRVIGISMQVWDYRLNGGSSARATCCAPADFDDARKIAESAGFPFYVFDFEDSFRREVIARFMDAYLNGKTPNPCMDCNHKVKFAELMNRASGLGAEFLATGHYAKIRRNSLGELGLFTSIDLEKDQSYFLYMLKQDQLKKIIFPVGGMKKAMVRQYLKQRGFEVSSKAESQDICFVSDSAGEFIERQSRRKLPGGKIVSSQGDVLGSHGGIHRFTVGQRRGLGIGHSSPLYVLKISPEHQEVVVGERAELEKTYFEVTNLNWIRKSAKVDNLDVIAKVRYRHSGIPCRVELNGKSKAKVVFKGDWAPVSPGQAAVFYNNHKEADGSTEILGGGIISCDEPR